MKKIPTLFERDWNGDRSRVLDQVHPGCEWVLAGEGVATRKLDGTCCLVRNGKLYKRREIKQGEAPPPGFELADHDDETGKSVGWVLISAEGPEDQWHRQAARRARGTWSDGTYELVGPKVQGNPEGLGEHVLVPHAYSYGVSGLEEIPRTFEGLRDWLAGKDIEGIVWHHRDGRMAKIKLRDFGLKRA